MPTITLKTEVKVGAGSVQVGDIKVVFDAATVTEAITVNKESDYSLKLPVVSGTFMLVVIPTPADPAIPLQDGDLKYTAGDGKCEADWRNLNEAQMMFNNSLPALTKHPTELKFKNHSKRPLKVQIVVGYDPKATT